VTDISHRRRKSISSSEEKKRSLFTEAANNLDIGDNLFYFFSPPLLFTFSLGDSGKTAEKTGIDFCASGLRKLITFVLRAAAGSYARL